MHGFSHRADGKQRSGRPPACASPSRRPLLSFSQPQRERAELARGREEGCSASVQHAPGHGDRVTGTP